MELTLKNLNAAEPGTILRDPLIKGLHVRVTASSKSFYYYFRTRNGMERRPKLGDFPTITLARARAMAGDLRKEIGMGKDPIAEAKAVRTTPDMSVLCDNYLTKHASRKKSEAEDRRIIEAYVKPKLGSLRVSALEYEDIDKLHKSMDGAPYMANRVLALLSKMFTLAEKWKLRPNGSNPCQHVERFKEIKRERYLSLDEAKALDAQLRLQATSHPESVAMLYLLIYSGARKSEIGNAKREWLKGNVLELPDSKTGARRIYLPEQAMTVISTLPRRADGLLVGISNPKKLWTTIRKAAGMPDLRMHDLRHSFASAGLAAGLSLDQIGALLGHSSTQTTKRYAHLMDQVAKDSAAAAGGHIARMMGENPPPNKKGTGRTIPKIIFKMRAAREI